MVHQAPNYMAPASQDAMNAVRAAKHFEQWGWYATTQFVNKRNIARMFRTALLNEFNLGR